MGQKDKSYKLSDFLEILNNGYEDQYPNFEEKIHKDFLKSSNPDRQCPSPTNTFNPGRQHFNPTQKPSNDRRDPPNENSISSDGNKDLVKREPVSQQESKPSTPTPPPPESTFVHQNWFYIDPRGRTQGPFPDDNLENWREQGYLPAKLLIKSESEEFFTPMNRVIERLGHSPFVDPAKAKKIESIENNQAANISLEKANTSQQDMTSKFETTYISKKPTNNQTEIRDENMPYQQKRRSRPTSNESNSENQKQKNSSRHDVKQPNSNSKTWTHDKYENHHSSRETPNGNSRFAEKSENVSRYSKNQPNSQKLSENSTNDSQNYTSVKPKPKITSQQTNHPKTKPVSSPSKVDKHPSTQNAAVNDNDWWGDEKPDQHPNLDSLSPKKSTPQSNQPPAKQNSKPKIPTASSWNNRTAYNSKFSATQALSTDKTSIDQIIEEEQKKRRERELLMAKHKIERRNMSYAQTFAKNLK